MLVVAPRLRRHVIGWLLIAAGIMLIWLWWNFRETFGGFILYLMHVEVDTSDLPFVAGVACLITGVLKTRGGWKTRLHGVPLRNVVGMLLLIGVISTVLPSDIIARADTWVAFRILRKRLTTVSQKVPRGLTSMECDLLRREGTEEAGCYRILQVRMKERSPTEDSLYSVMADAHDWGFSDVEVRPTYVAMVRATPSPGVQQGFLKLHQPSKTSELPRQLFLHPVADLYPLGDDWFHFVTH